MASSTRPLIWKEDTASSVAAATEIEISVPVRGLLVRVEMTLDSGSGSTIAPVAGVVTNPAGKFGQVISIAAAARVDEVPVTGIPYHAADGILYLRPVPDAGADNVVSYRIFIEKTV